MDNIVITIFQLAVLLFSVIIHEVSHGVAALKLGDDTAKRLGRLTLNPVSHIDPVGSILVPILTGLAGLPIGWARPVPYNPGKLYKDFKYGPLKVALAGPLSNFVLAILFGVILRLFAPLMSVVLIQLLALVVLINVLLGLFNLVPIPPLDGSKIFTILLPDKYSRYVQTIGLGGIVFVVIFLYLFSGVLFEAVGWIASLIIGDGLSPLLF